MAAITASFVHRSAADLKTRTHIIKGDDYPGMCYLRLLVNYKAAAGQIRQAGSGRPGQIT